MSVFVCGLVGLTVWVAWRLAYSAQLSPGALAKQGRAMCVCVMALAVERGKLDLQSSLLTLLHAHTSVSNKLDTVEKGTHVQLLLCNWVRAVCT